MKVYILLIYLNSTISFTEKNLCTFDKLCSNESGLDLQLLYLPSKPVDTLPFVIVYVFVLIGRNEVKTVLYALFSRSDHGRRLPMSADPIRSERRGAARRGAARAQEWDPWARSPFAFVCPKKKRGPVHASGNLEFTRTINNGPDKTLTCFTGTTIMNESGAVAV